MSKPATDSVATPIWPAPLLRAQKMHWMLGQLMTTSVGNQVSTAALLPHLWGIDAWHELLAIQQAVLKRCQQQQQDWVDGCAGVAQEYGQLKLANTLSKFIEQEYNVVAQFNALVVKQAASWAGLLENIQVDYAYWIAQKQAQL